MEEKQCMPTIAIVGRPNVGKSTLFNRFIQKRRAIVQSESGTTRDRMYETVEWDNKVFRLVDTGGHKLDVDETLHDLVNKEVLFAIAEADMLLFVIDKDGLTVEDYHLADIVKKSNKPVIYVVNKVDNEHHFDVNDIYRLGFADPIMISAAHGLGIDILLDAILEKMPEGTTLAEETSDFRLAIIGEPNAGKSTLMNKILNEERSIVSDVAGTTRDSVEAKITHGDYTIQLVDTAGIKKKKKFKDATSVFSLFRAQDSIEGSDVVVLMFDAIKGPQRDTRALFEFISEWKKACVLVVNKWDLMSNTEMQKYEKDLKDQSGFLRTIPMLFISAKTGRNVEKILDMAVVLWKRYSKKIKTSELNDFIAEIKKQDKISKKINLKYMVQYASNPPSFTIFVASVRSVVQNQINYITNQLIRRFDLYGVQIRVAFKKNDR